MSEPVFTATTELWYGRLPEAYRIADADLDWPMKRWLSGIGDLLDVVETLADRFDFGAANPTTADLVDPATADKEWLPWLAQHVGMRLKLNELGVPAQRAAIASTLTGTKVGTKLSIAEAAQKALVGTKYAKVFDHSTDTGAGFGTATMWDVLIVTRASETLSNLMPRAQATMASTDEWTGAVYRTNLVGSVAWVVDTLTEGTGSTQPLLANYATFAGTGNAYKQGAAYPDIPYVASLALRSADASVATVDVDLVFLDAADVVLDTETVVATLTTAWAKTTVSATAPADTAKVRLKVTPAASGNFESTIEHVAPHGIDCFVNATTTGATTVDGAVISPLVNWAQNASHDAAGGWTASNVTLTHSTERFKYNNSSGRADVTNATTPNVRPTAATPAFEGETVHASVWVLPDMDARTARLDLIWTKADGTTTTVTGTPVDLSTADFAEVTATGVAPATAKSVQAVLYWPAAVVDDRYWVDGWQITRGLDVHAYLDGNTYGAAWSAAPPAGVSVASLTVPYSLVIDTAVEDSHVALLPTALSGSVARFAMTAAAGHIVVTEADPYTHLLSVYADQAGTYQGTMLVIYQDGAGVETGRASTSGPITETPTQFVVQETTPADTERAWIYFFVWGAGLGDAFRFTQGGTRLGTATDWIAETSDPVAVVTAAGVKPAGVTLYHDTYEATWDDIETAFPTWADLEGKTWTEIEEAGL